MVADPTAPRPARRSHPVRPVRTAHTARPARDQDGHRSILRVLDARHGTRARREMQR